MRDTEQLATLGIFTKSMDGIKAPLFDGTQTCSQVDPEIFFPEDSGKSRSSMPHIKAICGPCAFKVPCLEYALANPELDGIWSATTVKDRIRIRRERRISA